MESQNYSVGKLVGEGSGGKVYQLLKDSKPTGEVIKFIYTTDIKNYLEPYIMLHLKHQNLISSSFVYIEKNGLCRIVQEEAYSDLHRFLKKKKVDSRTKLKIIFSILDGIRYLHSLNIIHGDIKPENILVIKKRNEVKIKICDFGLSRFESIQPDSHILRKMYTLNYKPPEVKGSHVSLKSDIWALGCTLYEIYYGRKYFNSNCIHVSSPEVRDRKNLEFNNLISNMLNEDCDMRPTIIEVCKDKIFKEFYTKSPEIKMIDKETHIKNLEDKIKELDLHKETFLSKALFLQMYTEDSNDDQKICNEYKFKIYDYILS